MKETRETRGGRGLSGVTLYLSRFAFFTPWLAGLSFLILYTITLSRGVLPADAGEFQLTGATLGVAHPPGFALYTMLSWLVSRWPGAGAATSINWLSAALAAGTVALVYRAVAGLTRSPLAGLAGAILLGLSTTFWAQAVTANIRMPAAFATALALERLLAYRAALSDPAASPRSLAFFLSLLSLALGLAVSHHGSLIFVAVVLGGYALWLRPGVLRRPWPLLAGLIPLLAWLYFPLRAGAVGAPPGINTVAGWLEHVLARGFAGDILFFASLADLPARLAIFGNILAFEFVSPALVLIALGAAAAFGRERGLGWALLLAVAAHVFVAMTYRAPQTVEYLIPVWVLMGVWAGLGLDSVQRGISTLGLAARAPAWLEPVLTVTFGALAVLYQFQATAPSYAALARDDSTRAYAEAVLREAPAGAVVLAAWHWATPMWYLQQVEGARPDVEVRYVVPQGESLAENWADTIRDTLPERPVVVTSFYAAEYAALGVRFGPLGGTPAWQVHAAPLTEPPAGLAGAQSFGAWTLLGYRLEEHGPAQVVVTAAWRTEAAPEDVGVFVHLLGPDGTLHSQQDIAYPAASYEGGEVLVNRFTLPLRPDAAAGGYPLVAGVYQAGDGTRLAEMALPAVEIPPQPFGSVRRPAGAIPLGNEMWLVGSRVGPGGPVRAGDEVRVALNFLAARPITRDYTVKVDLIGPGYAWQVGSNGTPAGGAMPTLKWIAGSRVTDVHVLTVPAGAAGAAQLVMAVYDAFTQAVLPILDPLLAAQGPTVPLGAVEITP
jgi:hypothetical protein